MKKFIFCLVAATAIIATTAAFADKNKAERNTHNREAIAANVELQGKRCTGSVGCKCTGFAPITNGKEWQKSYCKRCGHSKSCHR